MNNSMSVWNALNFANDLARRTLIYAGELLFLLTIMGASVAIPALFAAIS